MVIQSPQRATDFTLNASTGERISLSDLRGQTVLLFFGYTFCPDVCPTSIADLTQAMQILGPKKADKVQVVFVSVDPERDTPDRLREYLSYFNPDFLGMTGTADELIAASTPFGIFYEKHDGTPATGYLVDHTATITLIDKDGYVRLVFPYGLGADKMAEDLDHLVR
jgi:protein SCO1/2